MANEVYRYPGMKRSILLTFACLCIALPSTRARAQQASNECPRPQPGSSVLEPEERRSNNGVLRVDPTVHDAIESDGSIRYCYIDENGKESPTLRPNPGDLLILNLKNDLTDLGHNPSAMNDHQSMNDTQMPRGDEVNDCTSGLMTPASTNLHFHGLSIPPVCHEDDVLKTSIQPGDPPFQYRCRIPENEPPGLYWYHPHIHGFTKVQGLGGASGAIIVGGIERADKAVAGLPERIFVIRDQDLVDPKAAPSASEPVVPRQFYDRDGDAANTGTGLGKPAKDLSINFVSVPYPNDPPANIEIKPSQKQLWRVLNASAITYLNLEVLYNRAPQPLGLVALDGVPLNTAKGMPTDFVDWQTHLGIPPGSRMEFIVSGPQARETGLLVTRTGGHGAGRRERSQSNDCDNHSVRECAGAGCEAGRFAETACSVKLAVAEQRYSCSHEEIVFF